MSKMGSLASLISSFKRYGPEIIGNRQFHTVFPRHHQIKYIRESDAFRRICKISQYLFRKKYGSWILSCNSQCNGSCWKMRKKEN